MTESEQGYDLSRLDADRRAWVIACGARYWPSAATPITALPLARADDAAWMSDGGKTTLVTLPDWARDLGIAGQLLVPSAALVAGDCGAWKRCDWLCAAWLYLTGAAERRHELLHGPTLSYSFRLSGIDQRQFDYAWVNRIFLFLRRYAARECNATEQGLLGRLPDTQILLTHDVDALVKTPEIRIKQSIFHGWNALRAAAHGRIRASASQLGRAANFAVRPADFSTFAEIRRLEQAAGLRSVLHFYGGSPGWRRRTPARLLLDPSYDVTTIASELRAFRDGGWTIGVHPSIATWLDADRIAAETAQVAEAASTTVTHVRQHWLRFSWVETWAAQARAGLQIDSTLGFNDRPGFRNSAALRFSPWDFRAARALTLTALPMVFMDSHFYDYHPQGEEDRNIAMARWLCEIRAVRGEATINWHTHTITSEYGWDGGYRQLLAMLS